MYIHRSFYTVYVICHCESSCPFLLLEFVDVYCVHVPRSVVLRAAVTVIFLFYFSYKLMLTTDDEAKKSVMVYMKLKTKTTHKHYTLVAITLLFFFFFFPTEYLLKQVRV